MKGEYNLSELCGFIADKFENISLHNIGLAPILLDDLTWTRLSIVDQLRDLNDQNDTNINEFDAVMERIYDWSDFSHTIFLKSCEVLM